MQDPKPRPRLIHSTRAAVVAFVLTGFVAGLTFRDVFFRSADGTRWLFPVFFTQPRWAFLSIQLAFYGYLLWLCFVFFRAAQGKERVIVAGWFAVILLTPIETFISRPAAGAIRYAEALGMPQHSLLLWTFSSGVTSIVKQRSKFPSESPAACKRHVIGRRFMFTGIIEEVGRVNLIANRNGNRRITVSSGKLASVLKKGSSIAVSGVCLTAVEVTPKSFSADLAHETWGRTSFSRIKEGALVNLELPMPANGRFDGHIVQGHVDGTGTFLSLKPIPEAEDYWLEIEIPPELSRYVIYKGSLCIEGISLTVAKIEGGKATLAIIPHTAEATNLKSLKPGDPLNLEVDLIAKYVEKMMDVKAGSSITLERLVREGF